MLYAQTTLVDDVRARGVRVCLGSDWGPSGTKNLLGEMKVARIAADHLGYPLTDREIVEMVTTNPGVLLERCWHRPVGRLVEGAFADVTVLHGRGTGSAWKRIVAATERDVALVVIDGVPRYGYSTLMGRAGGHRRFAMTDRRPGPRRRAARPGRHVTSAWSWRSIDGHADAVKPNPQKAIDDAQARAAAGPRFASERAARAVPRHARHPARRPRRPAQEPGHRHDPAGPDRSSTTRRSSTCSTRCPIQAGVLAPLRDRF